jgi:hypothetical protein
MNSELIPEAKEDTKVHIPSSGVMVRVKLRRSLGSGKWVFMFDGKSSSVKSSKHPPRDAIYRQHFQALTSVCRSRDATNLSAHESGLRSSLASSWLRRPRSSSCSISTQESEHALQRESAARNTFIILDVRQSIDGGRWSKGELCQVCTCSTAGDHK